MGKLNKYEEALDFLFDNISVTQTTQLNMEAMGYYGEVLQELIDKETPVKPIKLSDNKYSCDKCAMAFSVPKIRFVSNQYCDVCGQKIDWSDEQ